MVIRVSNCDDARPLLRILGYRTRPNCGEPGTSLQTEDPERAFLAIDSGFPLPELEQTLQGGKPFEYPVFLLSRAGAVRRRRLDQASRKNYKESSKDLLDTILNDPAVARLYWALSKLDPETSKFFAAIDWDRETAALCRQFLIFTGASLCIRGGRVIVPGGPSCRICVEGFGWSEPGISCRFCREVAGQGQGLAGRLF